MKTLQLAKIMLFASSIFCCQVTAQTVINYQTWSTSNCNAFSPAAVVGGATHRTNVGQPKFGSSGSPVNLNCSYNGGSSTYGTSYEITYNFLANHQYTITVNAAAIANSYFPILKLKPETAFTGASATCNGVESLTLSGGSNNLIISNVFGDYQYNFSNGATGFSKLVIAALPDPSSVTTSSLQTIIIRKITITDNTPLPPPFTLLSSSTSRVCLTNNPVTFTIQNTNNVPGVTGYEFHIDPTKWLLNGVPAPAVITQTSNSLTLTPEYCASPTTVSGKALLGSTVVPTINNKTIGVAAPYFYISGPEIVTLSSPGHYTFNPNPAGYNPPGVLIPCFIANPTWSVSNPTLAGLAVFGGLEVDVFKYPGSISGPVTLKATINACDVNTDITKVISVNDFGIMASKMNIDEAQTLSISQSYPNPSKGLFTVVLNKTINNATVQVNALDGRTILTKKVSGNNLDINISGAEPGVYFIKITDASNTVTQKIVKQ